MPKTRVAILGAGVTAAYIRYACFDYGTTWDIYSQAIIPSTPGAFWLRWLPPKIAKVATSHEISIIPTGDAETYVKKQWGDIDITSESSSFPSKSHFQQGYDPLEVVSWLWGTDPHEITRCERITDERIREFANEYDIVFLTFPTLKSIKDNANYRVRIPVVSYPDSRTLKQNVVYYNGNPGKIVRMSMIFGSIHIEYALGSIIYPDIKEIGKIHMVSDIHPNIPSYIEKGLPSNVFPIGRYAQWKRHMLSHEAYDAAITILRAENV